MFSFRLLLHLILITLATSCGSTKKTTSVVETCDTNGTLLDLSNLDGCTWIILTDDGEKLLPMDWPPDFQKVDGQSIRYHATPIEGMNNCMAEDRMVKLDCVKSIEGKPAKPTCHNTTKPMEVKWMRLFIARNNIEQIEKYPYLDKYAYLFKGGNNNYLYDCQGTLLCQFQEIIQQEDCRSRVENLGNYTTVWAKNR